MTVENGVRMLAGAMVLISLSLGIWVNHWWFILSAFVGLNLFQSAFTGICPAVKILKKLGFKSPTCG